jgi:hypothetical protein
MPSTPAFLLALAATTGAVALAANRDLPALHMLVSGAAATVFAIYAVREHRALAAGGASESRIGGSTARNAGLVWTWGALSILVTYTLIVQNRWPEWWHFFLGFSLAAIASLSFAAMLTRDAEAGKVDPSLMKAGRALIALQLFGITGGVISMFFDGKFPRAPIHPDWAACNIFFFGALSIAAISINALRSAGKT